MLLFECLLIHASTYCETRCSESEKEHQLQGYSTCLLLLRRIGNATGAVNLLGVSCRTFSFCKPSSYLTIVHRLNIGMIIKMNAKGLSNK